MVAMLACPPAYNERASACCFGSASYFGHSPVLTPRRAAAKPAWVRSRIRSRSNPASAPFKATADPDAGGRMFGPGTPELTAAADALIGPTLTKSLRQ
jgi:hypothetical protein